MIDLADEHHVGLVLSCHLLSLLEDSDRLLPLSCSAWLPAPLGNFSVWIRAYWPDTAILDGTWKPPVIAVEK
jgi:hypothetical protein